MPYLGDRCITNETSSSQRLSNRLWMAIGIAIADGVLLDRISYQSGRAGSLLIRRIVGIVKLRDHEFW
jgi:hypothetical protein